MCCQVNGSSMTLLGETQEEDRRLIADLCLTRMQQHLRPVTTLRYLVKMKMNKREGFRCD